MGAPPAGDTVERISEGLLPGKPELRIRVAKVAGLDEVTHVLLDLAWREGEKKARMETYVGGRGAIR